MQCSLLESFSAEQAALTADKPAASEDLRRLLENNAFLTRDPASGLYALHSLFRAFLSEKLEATEAIDKAALYRRAGESCLLSGDLLRAARFFHRAGRDEDLIRLLDVFTMPRSDLLLFLSAGTIVPLVLSVPWRLRAERPVAYLAFIYFYLAEYDPLAAFPLLEEAENRFAQDPNIPALQKRRLQGETIVIRSTLAFNDLWAMCDAHKAAHELLGGRSAIFSRHMNWYFDCPHVSSLYLRAPGSYADLTALIEDKLQYFQDLSDGCSLGVQLLARAEYLLERGEFAAVEATLQAAVLRGGEQGAGQRCSDRRLCPGPAVCRHGQGRGSPGPVARVDSQSPRSQACGSCHLP
jgi:LuxR family maltose regulon positive regulatory protein